MKNSTIISMVVTIILLTLFFTSVHDNIEQLAYQELNPYDNTDMVQLLGIGYIGLVITAYMITKYIPSIQDD